MVMYVALETLEYLRKGGRISGAQAAIGTLLSVKPIIVVKHGVVETGDRVRTRSKARERLIEMVIERPVERLAILHTVSPDVEAFRDELACPGPQRAGRGRRSDRPGRAVRRSPSRTGLRRRGGPVSELSPPGPGPVGHCEKVAVALRAGTFGRVFVTRPRLYSGQTCVARRSLSSKL